MAGWYTIGKAYLCASLHTPTRALICLVLVWQLLSPHNSLAGTQSPEGSSIGQQDALLVTDPLGKSLLLGMRIKS